MAIYPKRILSNLIKLGWRHKYKTLIIFMFLYYGRKAWSIYTTWIRPMLELKK